MRRYQELDEELGGGDLTSASSQPRMRFRRQRRMCTVPGWVVVAISWACLLLVYLVCAMSAVVYARLLGPHETQRMLSSWAMAMGQTFVLQETIVLAVFAAAPHLFSCVLALPCSVAVLSVLDDCGLSVEALEEKVGWILECECG